MAQLFVVPFRMLTQEDPRNHVLDNGPDSPSEGPIRGGKVAAHCKVQGLSAASCAKAVEPIKMPFWTWTWVGPRNPVVNK